ncbi:hypothetical protein AGLY_003419, partial [Aphis glycines]
NVRLVNINRGHPIPVRNVANEELVLDLIHEEPELSVRCIASRTGISSSVIVINPNLLKNILFTDETVFIKDGIFNQHNLHIWSEENPKAIRIRGFQYKFSINIWCGLVGNTLLGPHELPARLNGQGFLHFIMNNLPVLLENVPLEVQETMWFMLDDAPPHHTNALFPDKPIGRAAGNNAQYRPDIVWPPRSPDFNPCDFFMEFYEGTSLCKINVLMQIINVADIIRETPILLEKTWNSLHRRMEKCIEVNGGHIEHLL